MYLRKEQVYDRIAKAITENQIPDPFAPKDIKKLFPGLCQQRYYALLAANSTEVGDPNDVCPLVRIDKGTYSLNRLFKQSHLKSL